MKTLKIMIIAAFIATFVVAPFARAQECVYQTHRIVQNASGGLTTEKAYCYGEQESLSSDDKTCAAARTNLIRKVKAVGGKTAELRDIPCEVLAALVGETLSGAKILTDQWCPAYGWSKK